MCHYVVTHSQLKSITYCSLFLEATEKIIYLSFSLQELLSNVIRLLLSFMCSYFQSRLEGTCTTAL